MDEIARNLYLVEQKIAKICQIYGRNRGDIDLVAVSKTMSSDKIIQAINSNCKIFAENYVKEALEKWPALKKDYPEVKLRFVGGLQSNKVAKVLDLFDAIDSVDSEKLALEIQKQSLKRKKNPEILIQVNIGQEAQKSGIEPQNVKNFVDFAKNDCKLDVKGLMCIPPAGEAASPYFALMNKLAQECGLEELSMGMSGDFEEAIALNATQIRLGTLIFGRRI